MLIYVIRKENTAKSAHYYLTSDDSVNPLKPNDLYMRRTEQLTSRCCILYIYSTNTRTEYFKHAV
jgi:hypothetical protein